MMKTVSESYISGMSASFRRRSFIRITLTSGGVVYHFTDEDIASAQKKADIDPLSRRIPKEEFAFSLFDFSGEYNPANPKGKWNALDENAPIVAQFGFDLGNGQTEWLAADYYRLDAKPTVQNGIATFKATSRLCHLNKTYYKGTFGNHTLYELAEAVFTDAGYSSSEYYIDTTLQTMITTAPLPVTSHINCLQIIAHAAGCTLRTTGNDVACIEPFAVNAPPDDIIIGLDSVALGGDSVSKIETLYKVQANLYEYTAAQTLSVLYNGTIDSDGETECHIEYDTSTDQTITITGATVTNVHAYANAADFTVIGSGTFPIQVTGKVVSSAVSTAESVVSLNQNGATDTEKNTLITNKTMQSALMYHVANYLQYRLTHTISYRGNPEYEPLDGVFLQTLYGGYISATVLTHTINYGGALSGVLVIKSLSEITDVYLYDSDDVIVKDSRDEQIGLIGIENYTSEYTASQIDEFITEVID